MMAVNLPDNDHPPDSKTTIFKISDNDNDKLVLTTVSQTDNDQKLCHDNEMCLKVVKLFDNDQ